VEIDFTVGSAEGQGGRREKGEGRRGGKLSSTEVRLGTVDLNLVNNFGQCNSLYWCCSGTQGHTARHTMEFEASNTACAG